MTGTKTSPSLAVVEENPCNAESRASNNLCIGSEKWSSEKGVRKGTRAKTAIPTNNIDNVEGQRFINQLYRQVLRT